MKKKQIVIINSLPQKLRISIYEDCRDEYAVSVSQALNCSQPFLLFLLLV